MPPTSSAAVPCPLHGVPIRRPRCFIGDRHSQPARRNGGCAVVTCATPGRKPATQNGEPAIVRVKVQQVCQIPLHPHSTFLC